MENIEKIGPRLRLARLGCGDVSIKEITKKIGYQQSENYTRGAERGKNSPTQDYVVNYERALGIEPGTTAHNVVNRITRQGMDEVTIYARSQSWGQKWQGINLHEEEIDSYIYDQAKIIADAREEALLQNDNHLDIDAYKHIASATGPFAMQVLTRAQQLYYDGDWSGNEVVSHYCLYTTLGVIDKLRILYPEATVDYEDLLQYGLNFGIRMLDSLHGRISSKTQVGSRIYKNFFAYGENYILKQPHPSDSIEILESDLVSENVEIPEISEESNYDPDKEERIRILYAMGNILTGEKKVVFDSEFLTEEHDNEKSPVRGNKRKNNSKKLSPKTIRRIRASLVSDMQIALKLMVLQKEKDSLLEAGDNDEVDRVIDQIEQLDYSFFTNSDSQSKKILKPMTQRRNYLESLAKAASKITFF